MDDWFTVADTDTAITDKLTQLSNILIDCGFHMSIEKNESGQVLTFLGVLLDSRTMTMRIDKT